MRSLLDTHVLLWWLVDDSRLRPEVRRIEDDPARYLRRILSEHDLEILSVELEHSLSILALPPHHKDPFDRILIAQSLSENLPIITGDPKIALYPVETIW